MLLQSCFRRAHPTSPDSASDNDDDSDGEAAASAAVCGTRHGALGSAYGGGAAARLTSTFMPHVRRGPAAGVGTALGALPGRPVPASSADPRRRGALSPARVRAGRVAATAAERGGEGGVAAREPRDGLEAQPDTRTSAGPSARLAAGPLGGRSRTAAPAVSGSIAFSAAAATSGAASGGLSDFLRDRRLVAPAPVPGRAVAAAAAASRPVAAAATATGGSAAAASGGSSGGADLTRGGKRDTNGMCARCDKDHDTDACPHYKKPRENHPDALRRKPLEMGGPAGNFMLRDRDARVARQPGDGSCLYHSLVFGMGGGAQTAARLRRELADWVERHPDEPIAETPLRDWVKWDSGLSVAEYARRQSVGGWGGGIEMAACARLKRVNVHVYERHAGGFKRISCFDAPGPATDARTVHVLYCGGVHYDALVLAAATRL